MKDTNSKVKLKRMIADDFTSLYLQIYPKLNRRDLFNQFYRYLGTAKGRSYFIKLLNNLSKKYPKIYKSNILENFKYLVEVLDKVN